MKKMRIRMHLSILFLFAFCIPSLLLAQQAASISGRVVDMQGEPIIGANVVVKGTTNGSITDLDGNYTVKTTPGTTLEITYMGYKKVEVKAKEGLVTTLQEDTEILDEVVVVGYGVQKKVNLTGSVASIDAEKIANRPVMNVGQALAGAAPGVRVTQGSGAPGDENINIQVRGQGSFNNSSPLILVDATTIRSANTMWQVCSVTSNTVRRPPASRPRNKD